MQGTELGFMALASSLQRIVQILVYQYWLARI